MTTLIATALLHNAVLTLGLALVPALLLAPVRLDRVVRAGLLGIPLLMLIAALDHATHLLWLRPQGWEALRLPLLAGLGALLAQTVAFGLRRRIAPDAHGPRIAPWLGLYGTLLSLALTLMPPAAFFGAALAAGFGTAAGAALVLIPLSALRQHLAGADTPEAFQGLPIALVTLGLAALAFLGFNGLVKV
ncbi:MAG TPA: Rnf-Nqr domain containing protein [Candidatus Macondimonas sp.]|nr:Rnf-Nqr domain containing protein [Candidatus Macondimonas sp.]